MNQMEQALRNIGLKHSIDADGNNRYWYQFKLSVLHYVEHSFESIDTDLRWIRLVREFFSQISMYQIHKREIKVHEGIRSVEIVFTLTSDWWNSLFTTPFNPDDIQLLYCNLNSLLHPKYDPTKEADLKLSVIRISNC